MAINVKGVFYFGAKTIEIWKDIPEYEGLYQVSNMGRVKSFDRTTQVKHPQGVRTKKFFGKILTPQIVGQGYLRIILHKNDKGRGFYIHTLILITFAGIISGKECNHKNGIKKDNRLENLEYCTRSENNLHFYRILGKGYNKPSGEKCGASKLTNDIVKQIRELYQTGNYTQVNLAKMFKTSQNNVSSIIHKLTWKDI